MPDLQPVPSYALPFIGDEQKIAELGLKFNPLWLKWFLDVLQNLQTGGGVDHNALAGLQGGSSGSNQFYHLTAAEYAAIVNAASGVYTPTVTAVTNLDGVTAYACQYLRVGNTVTVSGKIDVNPTAAGAAAAGIGLPIASNFGTAQQCGGAAFCPTIAGQGAALSADTANDRASMDWIAVDTTNQPMYFTFTYRVI